MHIRKPLPILQQKWFSLKFFLSELLLISCLYSKPTTGSIFIKSFIKSFLLTCEFFCHQCIDNQSLVFHVDEYFCVSSTEIGQLCASLAQPISQALFLVFHSTFDDIVLRFRMSKVIVMTYTIYKFICKYFLDSVIVSKLKIYTEVT